MKVKNDFPNADRVLGKLRGFVQHFETKKQNSQETATVDACDRALKLVDDYINAIERYLDSVCNSEDRIARVRQTANDIEEVQAFIQSEDQTRTTNHSSIIRAMIVIDRIAARNGLSKVFDYAEEFEQDYTKLTPITVQQKSEMTERARVKRREMGNFGLYIAASVTAGINKEFMISDDEARQFAGCESENLRGDIELQRKVKMSAKGLEKNMENIIR